MAVNYDGDDLAIRPVIVLQLLDINEYYEEQYLVLEGVHKKKIWNHVMFDTWEQANLHIITINDIVDDTCHI